MDHRSSWRTIRQLQSESLHAQALRLRRIGWEDELTEGQERLWRQLVAELVWRSARKRRPYRRCWCEICRPDTDVEAVVEHGLDVGGLAINAER